MIPGTLYNRFRYDADKGITHIETSHDDIVWNMDATYHY